MEFQKKKKAREISIFGELPATNLPPFFYEGDETHGPIEMDGEKETSKKIVHGTFEMIIGPWMGLLKFIFPLGAFIQGPAATHFEKSYQIVPNHDKYGSS